jgi:hypothetical protein
MGFYSWVSSCGTVGEDEGPHRLVRTNLADAKQEEVRRRAAEDVAWLEDDKDSGPPGKEDDL